MTKSLGVLIPTKLPGNLLRLSENLESGPWMAPPIKEAANGVTVENEEFILCSNLSFLQREWCHAHF